jgi:hypothetical protein
MSYIIGFCVLSVTFAYIASVAGVFVDKLNRKLNWMQSGRRRRCCDEDEIYYHHFRK